ncbi:alpha/beta hydrolase [Streptomyces albogriseolus]
MEQGRERGTPDTGPDGPEGPAHRPAGRTRRGLLALLVAAAVAVPLAGAARPQAPAPPPAQVPPPAVAGLDATYAAHRANAAEAARTAADHGYRKRATAERRIARGQLLHFDGRGAGLVTEVLGDLAHADRVAVLVPGSDTGIDTYGRFRATALALHQRLTREAPTGVRTAVVAWLGYETPGTLSPSVTTTGRAEEAAPELRTFIGDVRAVAAPRARVSLLCHSYGRSAHRPGRSRLGRRPAALAGGLRPRPRGVRGGVPHLGAGRGPSAQAGTAVEGGPRAPPDDRAGPSCLG